MIPQGKQLISKIAFSFFQSAKYADLISKCYGYHQNADEINSTHPALGHSLCPKVRSKRKTGFFKNLFHPFSLREIFRLYCILYLLRTSVIFHALYQCQGHISQPNGHNILLSCCLYLSGMVKTLLQEKKNRAHFKYAIL